MGGNPVYVRITRWHLAKFYALLTPRQLSTWVVWGFFATSTAFGVYSATGVPQTASELLAILVIVVSIPTAMLAFGLLISTGVIILGSGHSPGILGPHKYTFQADGLREETSANDTLIKWGGAKQVRWFGELLVIRVSPFHFHIVPRACFDTPDECDAFWRSAQRLAAQVT